MRCAGRAARIEVRRVVDRGLRGPSKSSECARTQDGCVGRARTLQSVRQCRREEVVDVDVCATTGAGVFGISRRQREQNRE